MSFFLSKAIWLILNPFNIILITAFFGFFLKILNKKLLSKFCYGFTIIFFFISVILPTGSYLNYLLEKNFHDISYDQNKINGILILSGATIPLLSKEFNQVALNGMAERLTESILLIKKYPNAKIIFAGGVGSLSHPTITHSSIVKKFFENMDIETEKIIFEYQSRNTYENILYAKKIAKPQKNEKWLLVTSAFHLKRSLAVAEKLEWKFIPYATDFNNLKKFSWKLSFNFFRNISQFQKASHEWLGLIAYYFMNKSSRIF